MGLQVALAETSGERDSVPAGVQDLEENPAQLGPVCTCQGGRGDPNDVGGIGDHLMHVALSRCRRLTRQRPDPARPVELLHRQRSFFVTWVCRFNLLGAAK